MNFEIFFSEESFDIFLTLTMNAIVFNFLICNDVYILHKLLLMLQPVFFTFDFFRQNDFLLL